MKKLLLLITLLPILANAQTKTKYVEANIGFSTGVVPFFPGASALYGAEKKYPSGFLIDYAAGIAFPTLVTAKGGVGYDFNGTELSLGVRPWPPASYVQVRFDRPTRLSDLTLSAESLMFPDNGFVQGAIFTIGWRFDNKLYKDIKHKSTK